MPKIFISYRRADSANDVGRIYDWIVPVFGEIDVFKDVDNMPLGADFRMVLREAVNQCDVALIIIGQKWLTVQDEQGNRRLDNPDDFVRLEVEAVMARSNCLVIPVLADGATMPSADDLPPTLKELAFKQAVRVRDDPDFRNDIIRLTKGIQRHFANTSAPQLKRSIIVGLIAALALLFVGAVLLPSFRSNPQLTGTPAVLPSVTPIPNNVPTTAVAKTLPCDAKITDSRGELLSVVRSASYANSDLQNTVAAKATIRILERNNNTSDIWYRISDQDQNILGWIPAEYVDLSKSCLE